MKSDVIRKRSRHDARRAGPGVSETPSASPGASRRASPNADAASPILAPDSTTSLACEANDEPDYRNSTQSELVGALGVESSQNPGFSGQDNYSTLNLSNFPGPYHPDYLSQFFGNGSDSQGFSGDSSDVDCPTESRRHKRRRMSNDSVTDPPSSAVSYSSFGDNYSSSGTSATSGSQRSSMEFPFTTYSSYGMMRDSGNTFWHPPMLPQTNSPQFIHPPMLPPDESPMDFLHPPALPQEESDSLFATFLHPPMLLPDENLQQVHPPMLPQDWNKGGNFNENSMQAF